MSADHRLQANLQDLSDGDLVAFLTYYYHKIKDVEQAKIEDPKLQRMRDELRAHEATYNNEIKDYRTKIKAARALCQLRNLKFSLD